MGLQETLTKPIGPLPLGAWIVVVGVGVGINVYTRKNSTPASSELQYIEDVSGVPGVGMGGSWQAVPPPTFAPESSLSGPINTNEEWGRAAINLLIAQGYDAGASDSAVRKYLASESLSVQEYALIRVALMKLGALPITLPPGQPAPVAQPVQPAPVTMQPPPMTAPINAPSEPAPTVAPPPPVPVFTPPQPTPTTTPPPVRPQPPIYAPPRQVPPMPGPWKRPGQTNIPVATVPTPSPAPARMPATAPAPVLAQRSHSRTVSSFPLSARNILTNGGTVKGGNGLTYRYDPFTSMAVPV